MEHFAYIGTLICVWAIFSVAANLVIGYGGMMAMGQAVYLCVGAYAAAILNIFFGVPFLLACVAAIVVSGAVAMLTLLPLLRLDGFYFALATLGLNFVSFDLVHNLGPRVQGSEGLYGLTLPDFMASPRGLFAAVALATAICFLAAWRIDRSPLGRTLRAVRDQPEALRSLGKDPNRYRIAIWSVAGAMTGLAGALYGGTLFYIDPTMFTFNASIIVLVYIGVGGLASIPGSLLGPLLLIVFAEGLRYVGLPSTLTGPLQSALYGFLLIALMMFRRQGLMGNHDFRE